MEAGYHKLEIYKLAHDLAVRVHKMTLDLPKFELYEVASQVRRSSKSVSANIVEGFALRKYKNEYLHYLYRAYGSSEETLEHLRYLFDTKSLADEGLFNQLAAGYSKLNAMIFNFIRSVEKEFGTPAFLREPDIEYESRQLRPKSKPEA